jgi:hypothetical protein
VRMVARFAGEHTRVYTKPVRLAIWAGRQDFRPTPGYRAMAQHVADDPLEQGYASAAAYAILKPFPPN